MCGIVGFTGESGAVAAVLEGLARLEYRGYDSAGGRVIAIASEGDDDIGSVAEDAIYLRAESGIISYDRIARGRSALAMLSDERPEGLRASRS